MGLWEPVFRNREAVSSSFSLKRRSLFGDSIYFYLLLQHCFFYEIMLILVAF